MNIASFVFGLFIPLGLILVGCFPKSGVLLCKIVHFNGAVVTFIGGMLYLIIHTVLCWTLCKNKIEPYQKHLMCILRILITTSFLATYAISIVLNIIHFYVQAIYQYNSAQACCQWIQAMCMTIYQLLFCYEFSHWNCKIKFEPLTSKTEENV